MSEECLICKAPLEYFEKGELMECEICHKKVYSKTRCVNGHFVCDECHADGIDEFIGICLDEKSDNPLKILEKMMSSSACHMHGPEHHVMVGAALLTAFKNAGGDINLKEALFKMNERGRQVPGGACGFWGACGAGISAGIFVSIVTGSTPLAQQEWKLSNLMTSRALLKISENGGPRCCKRDSYLAVLEAVNFVSEKFGIHMDKEQVVCTRSHLNNQCLHDKCPFNAERKKTCQEFHQK